MSYFRLGDKFPNFNCETTIGSFLLYSWANEKKSLTSKDPWFLFFCHPADFSIFSLVNFSTCMYY